jgi:cephalosporin hydroxylase
MYNLFHQENEAKVHPNFDQVFESTRATQIEKQINDADFKKLTAEWITASVRTKYSYGFNWLGVPIIQFPTDLIAFQEIVFNSKPSLIIECGVARGGSAIFWASIQDICGITPNVIGVDIDIRPHAIKAIKESKFSAAIKLIEGSSISESTLLKIKTLAEGHASIMIVLDSNHTHEHVLAELEMYANLVTDGCYLLVLDTVIENLPPDDSRPWGPGASPQTAVLEFMENRTDFVNDSIIEGKIGITVAPLGYWKKIG